MCEQSDRAVEFLPDSAAMRTRGQNRQYLTRPELSVLLAYAKIDLNDEILESDLPDDPLEAARSFVEAGATFLHVVDLDGAREGEPVNLEQVERITSELDVPVESVRLGGGGSRSPLWRQIQADVYGRAVDTVQADEGAAYGAAILAAVGIGLWSTVDAACDALVRRATVTEPRPAHVASMNHQYAAYTRLYPALGSIHG